MRASIEQLIQTWQRIADKGEGTPMTDSFNFRCAMDRCAAELKLALAKAETPASQRLSEFERGITVATNALHQAMLERGPENAAAFFEEYLATERCTIAAQPPSAGSEAAPSEQKVICVANDESKEIPIEVMPDGRLRALTKKEIAAWKKRMKPLRERAGEGSKTE